MWHPKKYREKPVVIEAMRYYAPNPERGEVGNIEALQAWGVPIQPSGKFSETLEIFVGTLEDGAAGEAKHVASPGVWIVKGTRGEFYPVKPQVFEDVYEEAE
jgi:hypothetical protein